MQAGIFCSEAASRIFCIVLYENPCGKDLKKGCPGTGYASHNGDFVREGTNTAEFL